MKDSKPISLKGFSEDVPLMWTALFCVNCQSYFEQRNLNLEKRFSNSCIDSKLEFLSVVSVITIFSQFSKRFWDFWMLLLMFFSTFPRSVKSSKVVIYIFPNCLGNLDLWSPRPWLYILSDFEDSLSGTVCL